MAGRAKHFGDVFGTEFHKPIRQIEPETLSRLEHYRWPGNVRELKNALERAVLLAESDKLTAADFPQLGMAAPVQVGSTFKLPAGGISLDDLERDLLVQALESAKGNQTRAASLLGINRDQVRYRIEKFGLKAAQEQA